MEILIADVKKSLEFAGWTNEPADDEFLTYLIKEVTNYFLDRLTVTTIPENIYEIAVNKVVGEFLYNKYATNQLGTMSFKPVAKRITEGDVTIEYDLGKSTISDEQRWLDMVNSKRNVPAWVIAKEGRFRWN